MMIKQEIAPPGIADAADPPGVLGRSFRSAFLALLLSTMAAYAPILVHGYPPGSWDSRYHAITARLFSNQFWSGDLYPRWLMDMNSGLGSPHFFYYPPLGFYIASLFSWLGGPTAVPQLGGAVVLLGFLSGLACYLWLARLMPQAAALTGAVFYLAAPGHLFSFMLVGGAYPMFVAMTFTPICLLGVELFRERKWYGLAVISLGFCAVTLSHIVVGLIFSGVPWVYFLARERWRKGWLLNGLLVLVACGVGLGCSGIYLVPALAYRPDAFMPISGLTFMFDFPGKPTLLLFYIIEFFCYGIILIAAAVWWWGVRTRRTVDSNFVLTCICLGLVTLALMTVWTRPLWLMLPITKAVQYTPRLFLIVDLCLAGLFGSFIASLRVARSRLSVIVFGACLAFVGQALVGAAAAAQFGMFDYNTLLWNERLRYTDDYLLFRPNTVQGTLLADKLGQSGLRDQHPVSGVNHSLYRAPYLGPVMPLPPRFSVVRGDAEVHVLTWQPRRIVVTVQARSPGELYIGQLYFPGWEAIDTMSGKHLPVLPSPGKGLMAISFPAGQMRLRLSMVARPPEYEGAALSILSLAVLVTLTLGSRRTRANA